MAKKKFDNVVEESFNEGYTSEPEMPSSPKQEPLSEEPPVETENLSENELLLRKLTAGDKDALSFIWGREGRSTYYLTDLHRASIDIQSHEEGITKNEIVVTALNRYFEAEFSEKQKAAARDRAIVMAIKDLEREIKKEREKKGNK